MNIWLITDTHFGHALMHRLCGRPKGFEEKIIQNVQRMVKSNDILIHLGDVAFRDEGFWSYRLTSIVSCRKWLIRGNHDTKSNKWYLEHGWDFVAEEFTDTYFGQSILFSHIPRNLSSHSYDINIHGHFHNSKHRSESPEMIEIKNPLQKLLAIEYTNYAPVTLQSFIGK